MSRPDPLVTLGRVSRLRRDAAERRWRDASAERQAADERHAEAQAQREEARRDAADARSTAMADPTDPAGWAWRGAQQARHDAAATALDRASEVQNAAHADAAEAARRHALAQARATGLDDRITRAVAKAELRRDERAGEGEA